MRDWKGRYYIVPAYENLCEMFKDTYMWSNLRTGQGAQIYGTLTETSPEEVHAEYVRDHREGPSARNLVAGSCALLSILGR